MPKKVLRCPIAYTKGTLIGLLVLQILLGAFLFGTVQLFQQALHQHPLVPAAAKTFIPLHVIGVQFYVVHLAVHCGFGFLLVRHCAGSGNRDATLAVRMWHWFALLVTLDGLLVGWLYVRAQPDVMKWSERSMSAAMDEYFADAMRRFEWDEYQIGEQCCGVRGYRDWLESEWQELDGHILEEKIVSTVPYSCCRSGSECMSAQGTTNKSVDYWTELKNVDMGSINQNGCWTAFKVKLQLFRYILCGTVLVVCVLQILVFIALRFLRMAIKVQFALPCVFLEQHSQTDIPNGQMLNATPDAFAGGSSADSVLMTYDFETPALKEELQQIVIQKKRRNEYYKIRDYRLTQPLLP